jgi:hypothetical protein
METILVRTVYWLQITNRSTSLRVLRRWIVRAMFEIHSLVRRPVPNGERRHQNRLSIVTFRLGFIVNRDCRRRIVARRPSPSGIGRPYALRHSDAVSSWLSPFSRWQIKVVIIITAETVACPFMWECRRHSHMAWLVGTITDCSFGMAGRVHEVHLPFRLW